jgi:hypothetical protein
MTMYVVLENTSANTVTASLIGWPHLSVQGKNEDEAVQLLRQSLARQLGDARIIPFELSIVQPWLQTAGMFQDDPFGQELDQLITEYRRERDAEDLIPTPQDRAA